MAKIIVFTNLTFDGVMQAPGSVDEDTRYGFEYGGWATPFAAMQEAGDIFSTIGSVLFGRWTYESFYRSWAINQPENPFTAFFNNIQKYVVSKTLKPPLVWNKSTLLNGDLNKVVSSVKDEQENNIIVLGSGTLIQSLMQYNLVDEFVLLIHPLVLGSGQRLFTDNGAFATLKLISSKTTTNGVIVATYESVNSNTKTA